MAARPRGGRGFVGIAPIGGVVIVDTLVAKCVGVVVLFRIRGLPSSECREVGE